MRINNSKQLIAISDIMGKVHSAFEQYSVGNKEDDEGREMLEKIRKMLFNALNSYKDPENKFDLFSDLPNVSVEESRVKTSTIKSLVEQNKTSDKLGYAKDVQNYREDEIIEAVEKENIKSILDIFDGEIRYLLDEYSTDPINQEYFNEQMKNISDMVTNGMTSNQDKEWQVKYLLRLLGKVVLDTLKYVEE